MASEPFASLGFVGYVVLALPNGNIGIRATSCDLKLSQTIEKPPVVSGRFDNTVYKLGPKEVGGAVAFPTILETTGGGTSTVMDDLWTLAVKRTSDGRLDPFIAHVKYHATTPSSNANFEFRGCMVDAFKWSVTQRDLVNCSIDVIGIERAANTMDPGYVPGYDTRNARAVVFADTQFEIDFTTGTFTGEWIRSFEFNLKNNVERFYTCGGGTKGRDLIPQDIAPKIRDISGTMVIMGRNTALGSKAENNQDDCYADGSIRFGYEITGMNCNQTWMKRICGVVYEVETMSLSNDIIEASVNWHALPGGKADELFPDGDCPVWNNDM